MKPREKRQFLDKCVVGQLSVAQYTSKGSLSKGGRRWGWGAEKLFKGLMVTSFPNLVKTTHPQIREANLKSSRRGKGTLCAEEQRGGRQ